MMLYSSIYCLVFAGADTMRREGAGLIAFPIITGWSHHARMAILRSRASDFYRDVPPSLWYLDKVNDNRRRDL